MNQGQCVVSRPPADAPSTLSATEAPGQAQGQGQQAFASQADWESVWAGLSQDPIVQESYGELLGSMTPEAAKVLQVRTMPPMAKFTWSAKPAGALPAKRAGILEGYQGFAQRRGIEWKAVATKPAVRGQACAEELICLSTTRHATMGQFTPTTRAMENGWQPSMHPQPTCSSTSITTLTCPLSALSMPSTRTLTSWRLHT
ncbi:unnamed protein product [Polarella glacialis]|uniref:Uncharacterized protein n=1 Tax=Polarella glacialis TaxID=89957 RepID=A0A813D6L3_POLGL|nr:unnamed protein product [Polarella glacialis]